ncbi:competence/damage-inducible protein A [Thiocapsa bogorovii]|uniref:competence/damage-inducible protein A n=1 Tax=Thiocapsa bogorovii TaxID=521689 RepID=UPI001E2C4FAE|nr:molybdopterin-binding protein [Thiocapsa bogorovii]UHD16640.1 competence/damage-inducible protein A [Thiocapsa bogorovii]
MSTRPSPPIRFGLIVIGDEILKGARVDAHLGAFKRMVGERGHELAWHWLLPDDPEALIAHLRFSMGRPDPVFVCGGIGATPDDHTRECAATAADLDLVRHPEAKALLEEKFGDEAYPNRILMADLPAGCGLIPNPINRIPGFSLGGHWFLPGFPQMAWPMAEWVLDRDYGVSALIQERAFELRGVPESALIPLMRDLGAQFPEATLFSLPHMGEDAHIRLGFRGRDRIDEAIAALRERLDHDGISYRACS